MAWCRRLLIVLAVGSGLLFETMRKEVVIPQHLLNNKALFLSDFISPEVGKQLLDYSKELKTFPTNVADTKFYKTLREHVGEAQPIRADGSCAHHYLIPNLNRTLCVLPGRIDVGRHFLKHGGVIGLKESYEKMVSRIMSFGVYMFKLDEHPVAKRLFEEPKFQKAAKAVCPDDRQYLDPFQFNFICQVPGQTVALHVDGVYFWGATRFEFPQWLLAAMAFSGLFKDRFVDQVQVVAYYHTWNDTDVRKGAFVYWDKQSRSPESVPPLQFAGTAVDGSKTVHAGTVYYDSGPSLPIMDKDKNNSLRYLGDDKWELHDGERRLNVYSTHDIRWTVVYRARCFKDKEEADKFKAEQPDPNKQMSLEYILGKFQDDLVKRGVVSRERVDSMDRLSLALLILDTYIAYPLPPDAVVPFNYCMLAKLFPAVKPLLDWVC